MSTKFDWGGELLWKILLQRDYRMGDR